MADRLTRAEMEQVIAEGGSVLHDGVTITTVAGLPSEAELAKGDPEREAAARADLEDRIAALEKERARLQAPAEAGTKQAPAHAAPAHAAPKADEGKK